MDDSVAFSFLLVSISAKLEMSIIYAYIDHKLSTIRFPVG
jgi:hypothetical protein